VLERGRGEVDCRDLPAVRGEPECLGSVPASCVECSAGTEVAGFGEQVRIRPAPRDNICVLAQSLCPASFSGIPVEASAVICDLLLARSG
jgi:hypothetical protein